MTLFRTAGAALRRLTLPALFAALAAALLPAAAFASELDLQLPTLDPAQRQLLFIGLGVCVSVASPARCKAVISIPVAIPTDSCG